MSSSANSGNDGRTDRQPAKRAFAEEFRDANEIFQDGDDERSPKFAVLPTGAAANRVLAMGTLTETEDVAKSDDTEYWQGRVVDPTGAFFAYAGKYQPEAMATLRSLEPPEYVAIVGKPRTYENDEGDLLTSLTPESITRVEQGTRDQWVTETAEQTLARIDAMEGVQMGAEPSADIERAQDAYPDATMGDYKASVKEALAQVAGVELADEEGDEDDSEDAE
jgi:RPA family protein